MRILSSICITFSVLLIINMENVLCGETEDNDPFYVVANDSIVANDIYYYLYTRKNPKQHQILIQNDTTSLKNSHFNKSKPVKFLIHGWSGHAWSSMNIIIKDVFLQKYDVNVISLDWREDADGPYEESVWRVPAVGKKMASFIDWLIENGAKVDLMHVIGYSLGGHVAGSTARNVKNGRIPYVTGLDPAKKYWKHSPERIDKKDGKYVEIIHTNTKFYGLSVDIGHNDFYPNGGIIQPGTENDPSSHARAYEYFAESVDTGGFLARQCVDLNEIAQKRCSNLTTLNMGGVHPKKGHGVFYLETNSQSPYSKN